MQKFIQIAVALLIALSLADQVANAQHIFRKFPSPESPESALPNKVTPASKNHPAADPAPAPAKEKEPEKKKEDPAPNPGDASAWHKHKEPTNSTATDDKGAASKDEERDTPDETDANTSTKAHDKKKAVVDKEKKKQEEEEQAEKAAKRGGKRDDKFEKTTTHAFDPDKDLFNEGKFGEEKPSGGLEYYKPNLKVRVTEQMAELMQEELLVYLQTYYSYDYEWPTEGTYYLDMFPVFTNITYADLKVDPFLIDPHWFKFNLTKAVDTHGVEDSKISMSIPLVEDWEVSATVTYELFWVPI